mmetsp:Transcript_113389/g.353497  ORF Transcript_113389/g.353497 Transcript_113389/m.353497 type:complete len:300 (-) Transcript_113389:133-1032(-)
MNSTFAGSLTSAKSGVPPIALKRQRTRVVDIAVAVVLPWLVFFLVISLFLFAFHDMKVVVYCLLAACLALALLFLALGCASRSGSFLAIGYLCLISLIVGTAVGFWLDREYLQRYWELDNGREYRDVDPSAGANETRDAGVVHFARGAFVDDRRTVGFVADGGIFCVAPVALRARPGAAVAFWAVGEDCCEMRSGFDCGTSREIGAATAVVERRTQVYARAIEEAVSVYGVGGPANSSKLVSFVGDPQVVIGDIWDEALTIALIALIIDLAMCGVAGLVLAKVLLPLAPEKQPLMQPYH